MDSPDGDILLLSSAGTGVNLQILRGQQNFRRWSRDFQVVAQAKGLWDSITGRDVIYAPPNPKDYGFDEYAEAEPESSSKEDPKGKTREEREPSPDPLQGDTPKPSGIDTPAKLASAASRIRRSGRVSMLPSEVDALLQAGQQQEGDAAAERQQSSSTTPPQAQAKAVPRMDLQSRLALYKFNIDNFEKSRKRVNQAMALLVCWVDATIRGRLQNYEFPMEAWEYLEGQYKLSDIRALEIAQNQFEKIHISRFKNAQEYINEIENTRQDIVDARGSCDDTMVISKMIRGLSAQYNAFVDHYHFFREDPANCDLAQMTTRLLTYESDLRQRSSRTIMTAQPIRERKIRKCDNCGKLGHTEDVCWETHPELKKSIEQVRAARPEQFRPRRDAPPRNGQFRSTPRKVVAMAKTNLKQLNKAFESNCTCKVQDHSSDECWNTRPDLGKTMKDITATRRRMDDKKNKTPEPKEYSKTRTPAMHTAQANLVHQCNEEGAEGAMAEGESSNGRGISFVGVKGTLQSFNNFGSFLGQNAMMLVSNNNSTLERDRWILDSGANTHAVNDKKWFKTFRELDLKIATADDVNTINIQGGGAVEVVTTTADNEEVSLELTRVAYSPDLRCNIISLSLLGQLGSLRGKWSANRIDIETKDGQIVGSALENEGLYILNFHAATATTKADKTERMMAQPRNIPMKVPSGIVPPFVVASIDFSDPVWKWHRRLGHLGLENLRRLLKVSEGMNITDKQVRDKLGAVCPVCATTRAIVRIPRDPATRRYKNAGELLHLDTWGPYPIVGFSGVKLFLAATDDATRFTWTVSMKTKDELSELTQTLLQKIQRTYDIKIRRVRYDNEFNTTVLNTWFETQGISIEPAVPYAHHQNGVAERVFRTERERSAAMVQEHILPDRVYNIIEGNANELLRNSTIPENLWPEAWKHSVWLKNRSPTRALKSRKTPFELLTGYVPDLSRERIWGSRTYVTVPLDIQRGGNKLHTPRGWMGYFMGCESESIYRIWNPEKNKVVRISTARIDDGEGLEDGQDRPSRNDRIGEEPREAEETSELSDSGETNSNESESDTGRDSAEINNTDDDAGVEILSDEGPLGRELTPEPDQPTGNHEIQEPDNEDSNSTDTSSSSEVENAIDTGRTSRFFTLQSAQANMTKRPIEWRHYEPGAKKPHVMTENVKCNRCTRGKSRCDGVWPFTNKCSTCIKSQSVCRPYGDKPEVIKCNACMNNKMRCDGIWPFANKCSTCIKYKRVCKPQVDKTNMTENPISNSDERHESENPQLTKNVKCRACTNLQLRCDGVWPFVNKCSACIRNKRSCKPHHDDEKASRDPKPGQRRKQPKEEKCSSCLKRQANCDSSYPFDNACTPCIKARRKCVPQGTPPVTFQPREGRCRRCIVKRVPCDKGNPCSNCSQDQRKCKYGRPVKRVPKNRKCNYCASRKQRCDGKKPCTTCVNKKRTCIYNEGNIAWSYETDRTKWKEPTEEGHCNQCLKYYNKAFGPEMCAGFPCTNCTRHKGGVHGRCTIDLPEGVTKSYKIRDEKVEKARKRRHKERYARKDAKEFEARQKKKGESADFDPEEEDVLDEDLQNIGETSYLISQSDDDDSSEDSNLGESDEDDESDEDSSDDGSDQEDDETGPDKNEHQDAGSQAHDTDPEDDSYRDANSEPGDGEPDSTNDPGSGGRSSSEKNKLQHSVYSITDAPATFMNQLRHDRSTLYEATSKKEDDDKENRSPYQEHMQNLVHMDKCQICIAEMALDPEPNTMREALRRPDADKWQAAMQDEYNSLIKNKTWTVVDRPHDQHVLSNRWVFRRKLGEDGHVLRYKARFVVRGFEQVHGVDFDETFASVVKQPSYKILFALQAMYGWKCHQMDVKTAFLHGEVQENIYLQPPDGFPEDNGKVLRLNKALYGLKQAPRQWYLRLRASLLKSGWTPSSFDPSVFIHPKGLFLTVYVDDINIFGKTDEAIAPFKEALLQEFEMTDLGSCAYYLGLHVHMTNKGTFLHQSNFVQQILNKFQLNDVHTVATPTDVSSKLTTNKGETATKEFTRLYQAMVGSVNYLATVSRPDIAFAVGRAARYMSNPSEEHMKELRRLFAYLKATMNLGLRYNPGINNTLHGMVDSDWGSCVDTRRSTTGWVFSLGGSPVSWSSRRQKTVALSSCEAEYMAASEATKEAIWIRNLLLEFKLSIFKDLKVPISIDNNSAMKLSKNPEFHARTKHIEMKHHFIREKIASDEVLLNRVDTKDNVADILTKCLPRPRHQELIEAMGMCLAPTKAL